MEKKIKLKLINILSIIFMISISLLIISCEDDAILAPQTSDDCQGSYCNLSLNKNDDYAYLKTDNPKIY
tara:strand:+ start:1172 stop:1378 length:207 start_codon:yes stop_codon:yes gene_type:complete